MTPMAVEHKPGLPNLPPGWAFSRNENGSITVSNADGGVVVEAEAASDRRMPEEMLHALAVAFGA